MSIASCPTHASSYSLYSLNIPEWCHFVKSILHCMFCFLSWQKFEGWEFVRQYYTLLDQAPLHLHRYFSYLNLLRAKVHFIVFGGVFSNIYLHQSICTFSSHAFDFQKLEKGKIYMYPQWQHQCFRFYSHESSFEHESFSSTRKVSSEESRPWIFFGNNPIGLHRMHKIMELILCLVRKKYMRRYGRSLEESLT